MSTYAIGDIHGGFKALIQVLNQLEVKEEDTLIFMGDYVDGWSESAQIIEFLIDLSEKINCVFIKGNHDVWCEDWLKSDYVNPTWYIHGGKETMDSYATFSKEEKLLHHEFFKAMPWYHIDDENRLFIHAGFTSMHGVSKEPMVSSFSTDRTLWEMALGLDKSIDENSSRYPNRLKHYNEIFIGHTPTINFGSFEPMNAANVWNIDTGAAFFGRITCMNVETKAYVQSDIVKDLYPGEKGRNRG
ncbi:metallophosphoesterase family protein [Aestuariibaculum lutulentum]|uniref:Serine/threonine protein phosphatase n=1 Tax=Aestuariibaculum lutulentum TaxID=2920935 RepID=A0ABS9RF84_9FLAO|nr:metallophosphoesterase family protein [Aestuariibaculum lutulentum]MCH4551605.1 serine/threonine protein phosphatase [Aestuariibaculum lutulentum]